MAGPWARAARPHCGTETNWGLATTPCASRSHAMSPALVEIRCRTSGQAPIHWACLAVRHLSRPHYSRPPCSHLPHRLLPPFRTIRSRSLPGPVRHPLPRPHPPHQQPTTPSALSPYRDTYPDLSHPPHSTRSESAILPVQQRPVRSMPCLGFQAVP
ncbi:hypothetical protein SDC9_176532 [bioreactor metagenome]|uniref:Uncharacterized protein n=1 Tax=bioreactor metagenome TaxID=1076179 RepID=A0A645GZN2_9ZZZZ